MIQEFWLQSPDDLRKTSASLSLGRLSHNRFNRDKDTSFLGVWGYDALLSRGAQEWIRKKEMRYCT